VIGVIFQLGSETIEVRINGTLCLFKTGQFGGGYSPIDGLKLSKGGVIKEFPDLKDREDWKEESIKRFKNKIKGLNTEDERMDYVIEDLRKFGYKPMYLQKAGHRIKKLK